MPSNRRRANLRLKAITTPKARTTTPKARTTTLAARTPPRTPPKKVSLERQAAAQVTSYVKPGPPSGLLAAGPSKAPSAYSAFTLTDKAFRLVHPTGPLPDFWDPSNPNNPDLIDSWVRIWNWVDWYENRTPAASTGTTAILPNDPLKSWDVPFGEGSDPNPVWPILTQECTVVFMGNYANVVGAPLARFGAARPGQSSSGNRIHIGADLIGNGGDVVVAPEAAVIGSINTFYAGTEALLLWLPNDTTLILGEVGAGSYNEFGIKAGDSVQKGQPLARIGTFNPSQQLDYDMLHVEMWKGHRNASGNWYDWGNMPPALLNPTKYILSATCP